MVPKSVIQNHIVYILPDITIYTIDKYLEAKCTGIVVIDKEKRKCIVINIVTPADQNIEINDTIIDF